MYTTFSITNPFFLKRLFPSLQVTSEMEHQIKNIVFFGFEFTKGFRFRKQLFLNKLKEHNISVSENELLQTEVIISDDDAKAEGPLGSL